MAAWTAAMRSQRSSEKLSGPASVVAAEPVPHVELQTLGGELHRALAAEARKDRLERLLLGNARVEGLLASEPRGDLQRLAAVVPEAAEHVDQELPVRDRVTDLQRRMPGSQ